MGVLGKAAAKGWSAFGKMLWKGGEQVATKSYRVAEHIAAHPIKSVKVGAVCCHDKELAVCAVWILCSRHGDSSAFVAVFLRKFRWYFLSTSACSIAVWVTSLSHETF